MEPPSVPTPQKQPSSIRFAEHPYIQPIAPSRTENSYNQTHTHLSNCGNGNVFTYNYYGEIASDTRRISSSSEKDLDKRENTRSAVTDSKRHKRVPPASRTGSRQSYYGSAETVMSISEGECRLIPLSRDKVKFPGQSISRQVERYMRTDFFGSSYVIPLWKTSQGFISNRIKDHKSRVITLGDVGYFDKEGGFDVLFNVYKTAQENSSIGYDPPDTFHHYTPPPGMIFSSSLPVKGDEYLPLHGDFKESSWPYDGTKDYFLACESPASKDRMEATALALPDGFTRHHTMVGALATMQDYFNDQAAGWYDYYSSDIHRRNGLLKGSLKLITACYTSRTWGGAVLVKEPSRDAQKIYAALYRPKKEEDIYLWERQGVVRTRSGPTVKEMKNNKATYESQCVAIEVTTIKVRQRSFFDFTSDVPSAMRSFVQSISSKIQLSSVKIRSSTRSFSY